MTADRPLRVAHVIAEFSGKEAMGRTIVETAAHVPGEHHCVTALAHDAGLAGDGRTPLASITPLGGSPASFPIGRGKGLARALDALRPDLVHVHAGALGLLWSLAPALRRRSVVLTVYAWPAVPGPRAWGRATLAEMSASNVLAPRVVVTTLLPPPLAAAALRLAGVRTVLTPDPRVERRLGGHLSGRLGPPVVRLPSGAPVEDRRARFAAKRPLIVFAGRAETVRGLDTLIAAFPLVREHVPAARLRLLLIPRPELPGILDLAERAGYADAIEVVCDPVPDLLAELAAAQVGAWPFKFDYTTSPPAMAVAEAMSVGLPVVATDVACVRAVLDPGVNGLVVPPNDPRALATSLARLLVDDVLWHRYAQAGVRSVRECLGWDRAAAVTMGAYQAALAP